MTLDSICNVCFFSSFLGIIWFQRSCDDNIRPNIRSQPCVPLISLTKSASLSLSPPQPPPLLCKSQNVWFPSISDSSLIDRRISQFFSHRLRMIESQGWDLLQWLRHLGYAPLYKYSYNFIFFNCQQVWLFSYPGCFLNVPCNFGFNPFVPWEVGPLGPRDILLWWAETEPKNDKIFFKTRQHILVL